MATDYTTVPGSPSTIRSLKYSNIHWSYGVNTLYDPSLISHVLDGAATRDIGSSPTSLIRNGVILGKIVTATVATSGSTTNAGKYRPSIIGATRAVTTGSSTVSIKTTAAAVTEILRLYALGITSVKLTGPATSGAAVSVVSEAVTLTGASADSTHFTISAAPTATFVTGSVIQPNDGSETSITVLDNYTSGIDMVNTSGTSIDQMVGRFLKQATLIPANIPFLTVGEDGVAMEAAIYTYFNTAFKTSNRDFTFSTQY